MDRFKGPEGPTGPRGKRGLGLPPPIVAVRGGVQVLGDLNVIKANPAIILKDPTGGVPQMVFYDTTDGGGMLYETNGDIAIARVDAGGVWVVDRIIFNKTTGVPTIGSLAGTGVRRVEASATGVVTATKLPDRDLIYDSGYTAAAASLVVPSVFSATYDEYEIECNNVVLSAAANLFLQLRSGATPAAGANYYGHQSQGYSTLAAPTNTVNVAGVAWNLHLAAGVILNTGRFTIKLSLPFIAQETIVSGHAGGSWVSGTTGGWWAVYGGKHTLAVSYDGFLLLPSSGNVSGRVRVYGLR